MEEADYDAFVRPWRCPALKLDSLRAARDASLCAAQRELEEGASGVKIAHALSDSRDDLLRALNEALHQVGVTSPPVAVYVTGSQGARLASPRSDVDLLIVYEPDAVGREVMGRWSGAFQTALRDIGFKVAMAHRTPAQCLSMAADELTIGASMLGARLLWGGEHLTRLSAPPESLSLLVAEALRGDDGGRAFAELVREGCRVRQDQHGRTVFLLEPDVKYGRGGWRDLQALQWSGAVLHQAYDLASVVRVAGAAHEELEALMGALDTLLRVRAGLHLCGGRFANDRLTFALQERLAELLGFGAPVGHVREFDEGAGDGPVNGVVGFMRAVYRATNAIAACSLQWQDLWLLPAPDRHPVTLSEGLCVRQGHVDLMRCDDDPADDDALVSGRFSSGEISARRAAPDDAVAADVNAGGGVQGPRFASLSQEALAQLRRNPVGPCEVALDLNLPLHPATATHLARVPRLMKEQEPRLATIRSLRRVLCAPHGAEELVQALSQPGLLSWLLPEFEPVEALVMHDVYHVYTVDAHLLRALSLGRALLRDQWGRDKPDGEAFAVLARRLPAHRRDVWLLACLLHDVGKGRGGDHSVIGAELALQLGARLGLTDRQCEHLAFLIREHLLLPRVSQRRDLQDPEVIRRVAQRVRSPQAMDELTLLAAVDIDAVSPHNLTPWKARLLLELHHRVHQVLQRGLLVPQGDQAREALRRRLEAFLARRDAGELPREAAAQRAEALERFTASLQPVVHESSSMGELVRRFEAFADPEPVSVSLHHDVEQDSAELVLATSNKPNRLVAVAGVLASHGLNILSAQFGAAAPRIVDHFLVRAGAGGGGVAPWRQERLAEDLKAALGGQLRVEALLARRRGSGLPPRTEPGVPDQVKVDQGASSRYTIVEIKARDRVGLLWQIARSLVSAGCDIHMAKIVTEGVRVIDTFYLRWRDTGAKLDDGQAESLRLEIQAALEQTHVD